MNDMELPSLGNNSNQFPENNSMGDMPQLPNLDSENESDSTNLSNPQSNNFEQNIENTPGLSGMQEMNSTPSFQTPQNQPEINSNPNNPFTNESSVPNTSTQTNQSQDLHNEISKAKLDTISSKMEVLEHRVSNIDNKLDLILKLIQAEVSTETKMKINIDEKMNQFR